MRNELRLCHLLDIKKHPLIHKTIHLDFDGEITINIHFNATYNLIRWKSLIYFCAN